MVGAGFHAFAEPEAVKLRHADVCYHERDVLVIEDFPGLLSIDRENGGIARLGEDGLQYVSAELQIVDTELDVPESTRAGSLHS